MVEAVAKVKSDHPSLMLAVEQDFEGSRGYGFLDYIILFQDLAIVITEAKMTEIFLTIPFRYERELSRISYSFITAAEVF